MHDDIVALISTQFEPCVEKAGPVEPGGHTHIHTYSGKRARVRQQTCKSLLD